MSTSIESLELEIKSNSQSAISGIDALASSLEKLKTATKGGIGLTSVVKQLNGLSSGLSNINTSSISNIKYLGDAIKTLSGVKVSSTIGKNIRDIGTTLSAFNIGDGANKVTELVSALRPLETLGKSSLSTTVNALNKLPEAISKIDTKKLYGQVQSLTRIMQPLATEMQKIANGFNAFPSRIQKLIKENDKLSQSNGKVSSSYINLWAKFRIAYNGIKTVSQTIAGFISKANDYIENINLFNVSMGKFASEAREYADTVGEVMGIDPGEWMRNQGVFMTLATGFGVASDRANKMSKNLTQLGYDISSFFNISYEDAMQKLQSGLAGELEPLRRIGYDLSQTRLQQEAYTLGINKKVSAMTQAEKAELRYHAILTQVTVAQGDMARTLYNPANQLRVLSSQIAQAGRAIGNIFIPMLQTILPYLIAFAKVIRLVANELAKLVGYEEQTVDTNGMSSLASGAEDYSNALSGAADNAKKLKQYTMGFDELNVIDPNKGSSGSNSGVGAGGNGFGFELPEYDFLGEGTLTKVDEIVNSIKGNLSTVLTIVAGIGAAIAGWAISKVIMLASALRQISGLKFSGLTAIIGLTLFLQDLTTLKKYIDDFKEKGASFYNVSGIISTFAGMVGDALIVLGNVKTGGALKVIEGIGQIMGAIHDMSKNGVNWDNVMSSINGLSNVAIGIGILTGNLKIAGVAMTIQGFTTIIDEIKRNWESIKQGDWSGVDKAALAIGIIEAVGGIAVALGFFSKIKGVTNTASAGKKIADVVEPVTQLDTSTTTLSSKLKSLAKNLGWGIAIIAEVAVAAGLIVGAIWGLGLLLEQVGNAWQPVLDNGETVTMAVAIGTGLLVGIGVATALLGTLGGAICGQIGIGIAILAEIGVATGLFLAEIWGIGWLLQQIGIAWQPVLDNGETIATGIEIGTALLVGIGVVTAALGAATVATAGALPVAIGLGTAILVELAAALILFCESLVEVANTLSDDLHPALNKLNKILPDLNENMKNFTEFMVDFAEMSVKYMKNSAIAGFSATVDAIIGFFTKDPIKALADDVNKQYTQSVTLNKKLALANPELNDVINGLTIYKSRIGKIREITDTIDTSNMAATVFTDMVDIGKKLADFGKEMKKYYDKIKDIKVATMDRMVSCINDVIDFAVRIKNEVDTRAIDDFTRAIKSLTSAVEKLPTSKTLTIRAIYQTVGSAPQGFASGGFPKSGQMFIAREAGAEMVGSIGRRTAVANNDQIVEGIASGVASANTESNALLREQNSLLRAMLEKESGVYLDGKSITKSVEKHKREKGRVLVTGGAY